LISYSGSRFKWSMDSCGYGGAWYPGQFEEYDKEEKTLKVNFMHPSDSSSTKFV